MKDQKFLAETIHSKLSNDLNGNKSLSIQILPVIENLVEEEFIIPVIIKQKK